jgi:hypothetical protein
MGAPQQLRPNKINGPPTLKPPNPDQYRVSIPKAKRTALTYRAFRAFRALFPHGHNPASQKGRENMKFDHLDKTKDLAHCLQPKPAVGPPRRGAYGA